MDFRRRRASPVGSNPTAMTSTVGFSESDRAGMRSLVGAGIKSNRPSRPLRLRQVRGSLSSLLLGLMCITGGSLLWAQTAHFASMVRTLGSGSALNPVGVAVDRSGDVFLADATDNAIKEMVAVNGSIPVSPTVLTVGSGFNHPEGVAVDVNGNVFVADQFNNAVKQIVAGTGGAAAGTVNAASTVRSLGSGFNHPEGVAVDANGDVFVADLSNNAVKEMLAVAGSIPASPTIRIVGGGFNQPSAVAVDGNGNVFVADTINNAVKQIVAGTGGAAAGTVTSSSTVDTLGNGFSEPDGVAVDGNGDVFVADFGNDAVKEIVAVNGIVPASPVIHSLGAGFSQPNGVTVDASGNVFVAEYNLNAVLEIGSANFATLPVGTTSIQQSLTFSFDSSGTLFYTPFVVLTMGAPNLDFQAAPSQPSTVCVAGHTYYAGDTCTVDATFTPNRVGQRLGAVQLMGSGGLPIATGDARGVGTGPQVVFPGNNTPVALGSGFLSPAAVAVDGSGNVFVADSGNGQVKEMMAVNGSIPATPVILSLGSGFSPLNGVAVDGSGNVFVADTNNNAIEEIVAVNGSIPGTPVIRTLGSSFNAPFGVAVDASGNVFVAGNADENVTEIVAVNGTIPASPTLRILGSGFIDPIAVGVDVYGNVFVGDWGNNALKEIVAVNGIIPASPTIRIWSGGFSVPNGLAVDPQGNVFIADAYDNAVKEMLAINGSLPASPVILTLGSGFGFPTGLAVDPSGDVFVADFDNNAVKELPYATVPSLSFATTPVGSTSSDSPQTITVANDGNANLSFAIPARGLNPSLSNYSFVIDSGSNCPQLDVSSSAVSLAPGAFCTYQVSFSPTAAGSSITGSLALADNNLNASPSTTQAILLNGSATGSQTTNPQTITFPPLPTPINYGTAPLTLMATASSGLTVNYTVTGPASLNGSTLTLTAAGTVVVTASQSGNASYSAASPVSDTIVILATATTTSLTSSSSAITAGQSLTLAATVLAGAAPVSTGTVSFYSGITPLGAAGLNAQGVATLTITTLPVGSNAITATYAATADYAGSTSTAQIVTVAGTGVLAAATATSLTISSSAITSGQSLTLAATVLAGAAPVSTGTVTFYNGTTSLGVGTLDAQGVAILTTTTLPVGTNTLIASYAATADYESSTSVAQIVTVAATGLLPTATTTSLTSSSSAITAGQSLILTAIVLADATPVNGGLVIFYSGTTSIGAGTLDAQGVAILTITTLPVGSNAITAAFAATSSYAGSTSAAQIVTVAATGGLATATATSLTISASAITAGQSLTLAATVLAGAAPVSTGTVTFYNGTTSLGAGTLDAEGVAILTTTALPVGTNTLIASYAATADYESSTSAAQIVTVAATVSGIPVPSYGLTASPTSLTIVRGQTGATTLTITPAGGFTGTLTFSCGNLPAFATCAFAPPTIALTGNDQVVQVGLTVATDVQQPQLAVSPSPAPFNPLLPAMVLLFPAGLAGLAIGDKWKRAPRLRRWLQLCLLLAATATVSAAMTGCNTGTPWTTPVGTSTVMVVATPASGSGQSLAISVTITQ
ncbi:MAG: Ig-like domain repeat protein [Acidobacteriaceae bacterium]